MHIGKKQWIGMASACILVMVVVIAVMLIGGAEQESSSSAGQKQPASSQSSETTHESSETASSTQTTTSSQTSSPGSDNEHSTAASSQEPKNVILLVGDGMGPTQVAAAAYFKGHDNKPGSLAMATFDNVGFVRTYSHNRVVTDSAAAATAFSSAYKTDNGVLGLAPTDPVHQKNETYVDVASVLEIAEANQMSTGLVSTTRITHATPAAFASSVAHRDNENKIAKEMLLKHDVEVLLGGGKRHFLPNTAGGKREDGLNLLKKAKALGYDVLLNKKDLKQTKNEQLLGLFADSHMAYAIDREATQQPSLKTMTQTAIQSLKDDKDGFFLMVEGGRIDHAGHANWPATNIRETLAFDQAVKAALTFAKQNEDTIVIVTADHETGGMSIGADGVYGFKRNVLKQVAHSAGYIAQAFNDDMTNVEQVLQKYTGIQQLKDKERQWLRQSADKAAAVAKILSERALIGWTTSGHTAVHVPVYAYGPHTEQLTGTINNTKIAAFMTKNIIQKPTVYNLKVRIKQLHSRGALKSQEAAEQLLQQVGQLQEAVQSDEETAVSEQVKQLQTTLQTLKQSNKITADGYQSLHTLLNQRTKP